jgi:hypothetical protein
MHRLPNIAIGRIASRVTVRLYCPALLAHQTDVGLDLGARTSLYEFGMLPAVYELADRAAAQEAWPASYEQAAIINSAGGGDGRHNNRFLTRQLPGLSVTAWSERLLDHLTEQDPHRFLGAFFGLEIQGTKLAYQHDPADEEARVSQLEDGLLEGFDRLLPPSTWVTHEAQWEADRAQSAVAAARVRDLNDRGEDVPPDLRRRAFDETWLVDVALSFSAPGYVIQWSKAGRDRAMRLAFPRVPAEQRLSARIDHSSSLDGVTGWLLMRPEHRDQYSQQNPCTMAQCYDTTKYLWYKRGTTTGAFSQPRPRELISDRAWAAFVQRSQTVSRTLALGCGGEDNVDGMYGERSQLGSARFEQRIPVQWVTDAHRAIPPGFELDCLVACSPDALWLVGHIKYSALLHSNRDF